MPVAQNPYARKDWRALTKLADVPEGATPTPVNACMMQAFEWYVAPDGKHFRRLARDIPSLEAIGISALWIPPACKGGGDRDNGYGIYGRRLLAVLTLDLWDLGEFDQKGTVRTKWGSYDDLKHLQQVAKHNNVLLYFDAVLNHKASADETETCRAVQVDWDDRTKTVGDEVEISAWLGFTFPGRKDKYSNMKWHWEHFTGTDWDEKTKKKAIFRILGDGKYWASSVDKEKGNYDYLMFADIDHAHPEVKDEIKKWAVWLVNNLELGGIRFDAIKHFSEDFLVELVMHLTSNCSENLFFVGELWNGDLQKMIDYLNRVPRQFSLFDCPLVHNFSEASRTESSDLRKIFDNTLVGSKPINAVTLVQNHDTQPGQALEVPIEDFFKPLAYALILLRMEGYPAVFYGDLYGLSGPNEFKGPSCGDQLGDLILARKLYAYGEENAYFDYSTCIGWVRRGTWDRKDGCAVVMSNAGPGEKRMFVGKEHIGEIWTDVLSWSDAKVEIGGDGFGSFVCGECSVSVFVNQAAEGRGLFGKCKGMFKVEVKQCGVL